VPRNKRPQDRAEKREEIIAVARRLFIEDGYEATPMGHLAKTAGVTPNTIYWYFDDKDDVLIAVLIAVVADAWQDYQSVTYLPIADRLLWVVERLQQLSKLVTTVHTRVSVSPALNEWHDQFHLFAEGLFRQELDADAPPLASLDAEVRIGVFAVEGMLTHSLTSEQQRATCEALAARWTNGPGATFAAGRLSAGAALHCDHRGALRCCTQASDEDVAHPVHTLPGRDHPLTRSVPEARTVVVACGVTMADSWIVEHPGGHSAAALPGGAPFGLRLDVQAAGGR
jgi:AcrR family transcriptional regulator